MTSDTPRPSGSAGSPQFGLFLAQLRMSYETIEDLAETLEVLSLLLNGDEVSYRGERVALEDEADASVELFILVFSDYATPETLRLFAREVIPAVRGD